MKSPYFLQFYSSIDFLIQKQSFHSYLISYLHTCSKYYEYIWSLFICFSYCVKSVENIECDMYRNRRNDWEETNKILHPVVFQTIKYQVSWRSFGSCQLQFLDWLHYDCVRTLALKCNQHYRGYLLSCQKHQLKY